MMPALRAVRHSRLLVKLVPLLAHSSAARRPIPGLWLRLVIMLSLVSVAMPEAVVAGDFDPAENPWGFGYDGGLTLRRKLGDKWEVGISGGPNDYLSSTTEEQQRETIPPSNTDWALTDYDVRREGGFVAPHFGRTVWQRDAFDLLCYLRGKHEWSNRSDYSERSRVSNNSTSRDWTSRDEEGRNWSLSLGFRPGYRPVPWFSIEVAFDLTYAWTKNTYRNEGVYDNGNGSIDRTVTTGQTDGQSFSVNGYRGTSSFQFIIWF